MVSPTLLRVVLLLLIPLALQADGPTSPARLSLFLEGGAKSRPLPARQGKSASCLQALQPWRDEAQERQASLQRRVLKASGEAGEAEQAVEACLEELYTQGPYPTAETLAELSAQGLQGAWLERLERWHAQGQAALQAAAACGDLPACQALLGQGLLPDLLTFAQAWESANRAVLECLEGYGLAERAFAHASSLWGVPITYCYQIAMELGIVHGQAAVVRVFHSLGKDLLDDPVRFRELFYQAALSGDWPTLAYLYSQSPEDNLPAAYLGRVMKGAIRSGSLTSVAWLKERCPDLPFDAAWLTIAFARNDLPMLEKLLGFAPEGMRPGKKLLWHTSHAPSQAMLDFLIAHNPELLTEPPWPTRLLRRLVYSRSTELLAHLQGAYPALEADYGAFYNALASGQAELVKLVGQMAPGLSLNGELLRVGLRTGEQEILDLLWELPRDLPWPFLITPATLYAAVEGGNPLLVEELLVRAPELVRFFEEDPALRYDLLHAAILTGRLAMIQTVVGYLPRFFPDTELPLWLLCPAVEKHQIDVLHFVQGLNPSWRGSRRLLQEAALNPSPSIFEHVRNMEGTPLPDQTTLFYATHQDNPELVELVLSANPLALHPSQLMLQSAISRGALAMVRKLCAIDPLLMPEHKGLSSLVEKKGQRLFCELLRHTLLAERVQVASAALVERQAPELPLEIIGEAMTFLQGKPLAANAGG